MRSLILMTATIVLFGCSSTLAQQVRSTRNPPAMGATSQTAVPGTIPTGGAAALGTINTGAMGRISGSTVGRITSCATSGATTLPFNASTADPITGVLPPQILPGATIPPAPSYGISTMTGVCDPTTSARDTIEALGSSVAVTVPGLATTAGATYLDATTPSTSTETGAPGQSPQLLIPTPNNPAASPCVGTTTIPMTVITDPSALATPSGTGLTGTSNLPSSFGC